MSLSTICPCGIHRDDCDYHKPAPESEPITLRAAPDSEAPTVRFGTYSYSFFVKSDELVDDSLAKIAERVRHYQDQQMEKLLNAWAKAYFS